MSEKKSYNFEIFINASLCFFNEPVCQGETYTYGIQCDKVCHCEVPCRKDNGTCVGGQCVPGRTGEDCQKGE